MRLNRCLNLDLDLFFDNCAALVFVCSFRITCHNLWICPPGVFATLRAVPQKEGYLGLYKGNGAMMVRIFPYGAIQFMAFDNYKKVNHPNVSIFYKFVLGGATINHTD